MYRIIISSIGNYAATIQLEDQNDVADLVRIMREGDTVILVNELPEDISDIFKSNMTQIIETS